MGSLLTALLLTSSLDRTALKAVLHRAAPDFKRCYETALRPDPDLAGRARLTLTIAATGQVTETTVEFPSLAPRFTQCLREVAMKLNFLHGPQGYRLSWPIVFGRN